MQRRLSAGLKLGSFLLEFGCEYTFELDLGEFVRVIAYEYDFGLLIEALNTYQCSHRANIALARIAERSEQHKLTFSAEKTIAIYFRNLRRLGRRRNPSTTPRKPFIGVPVEREVSWRHDGCEAQRHGSCGVHQGINSPLCHIDPFPQSEGLGLREEVLKQLYKLGMERLVKYTCSFWWTGTDRNVRKAGLGCPLDHQVLPYHEYGSSSGSVRCHTH